MERVKGCGGGGKGLGCVDRGGGALLVRDVCAIRLSVSCVGSV